MKLKDLKARLDKAYEDAGEGRDSVGVEVWLGEECFEIERLSQFSIIPDVIITLKVPESNEWLESFRKIARE